jgi:hypothetical protein
MNHSKPCRTALFALATACAYNVAAAKPIAYAHGTTVMAEYGAGNMTEVQVFYAPRYDLSIGAGYLALDSEVDGRTRDITYARVNYLVKRWNQASAQANLFTWGGAGNARVDGDRDVFAWNAGAQPDYETRRVYVSAKSDYHDAPSDFAHRIDTLQLGLAPYRHEYGGLATWFVLQGRDYTGEIRDGIEWALLLRLFKGSAWVEAGATTDGKLQAMFMFNF